ncbi:Uncharacterised protein [Vibrio cholerae]|nr:Uncharacterised protein [Vibrio cholerae]
MLISIHHFNLPIELAKTIVTDQRIIISAEVM